MPTIRSIGFLSACLAVACALPAHAQPSAAPTGAAVEVPPMSCTKPGEFAPIDRNGPEMGRFQKRFDEYKTCVNQYTQATGAKANEYAAQSRAYADAANKAIDDYNTYVTGLNESNKASKPTK